MRLAAMLAGAAICVWTLRCYLAMLDFAVRAAERSRCEKCAAYSTLELSGAPARRLAVPGGEEVGDLLPVGVRCRKCGHEWMIG